MLSPDILRHRRELQRRLRNHQYERTPEGLLIEKANLLFSGMFRLVQSRHPLMERAFESGDPERVRWVDRWMKALGGPHLKWMGGYERFAVSVGCNIVVDEGINNILDSALSGAAQTSLRYLSLAETDTTPAADWTAANYRSGGSPKVTEYEDYSQGSRPQWQETGVASKVITNVPGTGNGEFTATNVSPKNLYIAALISAQAKDGSGDASAKLTAAKRFDDAPRQAKLNDKMHLTYQLTGSSS